MVSSFPWGLPFGIGEGDFLELRFWGFLFLFLDGGQGGRVRCCHFGGPGLAGEGGRCMHEWMNI